MESPTVSTSKEARGVDEILYAKQSIIIRAPEDLIPFRLILGRGLASDSLKYSDVKR